MHRVRGVFERRHYAVGRLGRADFGGLAVDARQASCQPGRLLRRQVRIDGPIFLGKESADLALALHDHPQRHRLHPAGGETAPHFVPQQRRNLIAHQAVQHAARLLRIHQVHVHLAGLLERLGDRLLGDLVEHHAVDPRPVLLLGKLFLQVGADGFAFAVGVGRQIHILHFPGSLFELGDQLFLAFDDFVARLETVLHVDCQIPFG